MGKKKAAKTAAEPAVDEAMEDEHARRQRAASTQMPGYDGSQLILANDDAFSRVITTVEAKMTKAGLYVGNDALIHVLPVPALSTRVLFQNEGFPLARVYGFAGLQASYKSTFLAEVMRWHRLCGGKGILMEAESKPTPELRNAILNYDANAVRVEDCHSLEDWQQKTTFFTMDIQKRFSMSGMPGRTVPICIGVDSLMGKASRETVKKIKERGHASRRFAIEAGSVSDYMKAYPQMMQEWPFTFIGISHYKPSFDDIGNPVVNIPGGYAMKFHASVILLLDRVGSVKQKANCKVQTIKIHPYKNSYGAEDMRINVDISFWNQNVEGVDRLYGRWEWWDATTRMLNEGWGWTKTKSEYLLPKIKEVIDIHEKSMGNKGKGYWSNRLSIPSSNPISGHDFGYALEHHPEVLAELYPILGVNRRPFFQPGVDFQQQLEGYSHVVNQAQSAKDRVDAAQQLMDK